MADDNGINWKELSVDKAIDAILIPVGLFAALWFQGWVDEKKEKEDYASLIADFQTEFANNRGKAKVLETEIGPIAASDAADQAAVLGPMHAKFDAFKAETERLSTQFDCVDLYFDVSLKSPQVVAGLGDGAAPGAVPAPETAAAPDAAPAIDPLAGLDPETREELANCEKLLDAMAKEKPQRFPGVDLSPFYQYVVWQVYLEDGIKLFKDPEAKRLGLKLGESYAAQREVESRVKDLEQLFNDSMMRTSGKLSGLVAESAELLPEDPDMDDLKQAQERIQEMSGEAFELRYEIENIRSVMTLKVSLLKDYIGRMHAQLDDTMKALEIEKARVAPAK